MAARRRCGRSPVRCTTFAAHHANDVGSDHGHKGVEQKEEQVDGVPHPIRLALVQRLSATGSAEELDGDDRQGRHGPQCTTVDGVGPVFP